MTGSGNAVPPGTAITITASSTDPDGDAITYVWEGRPAQTSSAYPLGKNTVRVKAVDSTGAESSWAAIVFFVADPNSGGGMTLTGQWDQLDYGTTTNGITFTRSLSPGVYSQLEMYYYTNHDYMYNKSNITYCEPWEGS
ncbi:hypothetical protein HNQ56_003507 [Anaerotaenia torta]|uniref:hypothetical protein n=1 Tax=Anaerotaenia torta TaxID=433293 RepID=UPI003D1965FE